MICAFLEYHLKGFMNKLLSKLSLKVTDDKSSLIHFLPICLHHDKIDDALYLPLWKYFPEIKAELFLIKSLSNAKTIAEFKHFELLKKVFLIKHLQHEFFNNEIVAILRTTDILLITEGVNHSVSLLPLIDKIYFEIIN